MKNVLIKQKPEKMNDKLTSPLWHNKHITNDDFFLQDWYDKGITTPLDLLTENKEVMSRQEVIQKIQNNNHRFSKL